MSNINIIQPDQVIIKSATDYNGVFEFRPLEPGFGITLGNSLRRVLLSSLEGFAITSIKIEGVDHEFTTIKGVVEDVSEIILNLKKIRLKKKDEDIQNEIVNVSIKEKEKIIAGDFGRFMSGFQVLNKELVVCNKDKLTTFSITFVIERGKGYQPAEEKKDFLPIGTIAIDAIYTPIKTVQYKVENYRIDQSTLYEKLIVEIKTDGSLNPKEALSKAAIILIKLFKVFKNERFMPFDVEDKNNVIEYSENLHILGSYLSDLYLSVMAKNYLKSYKMITLGKLVSKQENDLKKVKHFCIKTMIAMNTFLTAQNIYFGLDVATLDKKLLINET